MTLLRFLSLFLDLEAFRWRLNAWRLRTLPLPVILNLLKTDFLLFCFGIFLSDRRDNHDELSPQKFRLHVNRYCFRQLVDDSFQKIVAEGFATHLSSLKNDHQSDLVSFPQKLFNPSEPGSIIVLGDKRRESYLLDLSALDPLLNLPGFLFLLIPELPEIDNLGNGRVGGRGNFNQREILCLGFL